MMKKTASVISSLFILVLLSLFLSCSVDRAEPDVSAYAPSDVVIVGMNGTDFKSWPFTWGSNVKYEIPIRLKGGEFDLSRVTTGLDVKDWIQPESARIDGLSYKVKPESDDLKSTFMYIEVTGTPNATTSVMKQSFSVVIPAYYIYKRYNPVAVQGGSLRYNIVNPEDRFASISMFNGYNGAAGNIPNSATGFAIGTPSVVGATTSANLVRAINLTPSTHFKAISKGTDVSSWFKNLPDCLKVSTYTSVSEGDSSVSVQIAYDGNADKLYESFIPKIVIPKEYLQDGDEKGDLNVFTFGDTKEYRGINTIHFSQNSIYGYVKPVVIGGTASLVSDPSVKETLELAITGGYFLDKDYSDITSWFTNAPKGLTFKGPDLTGAKYFKNTLTVEVIGTPLSISTEPIAVTLPEGYAKYVVPSATSTAITPPSIKFATSINARYDVKAGDFFSWKMYDLATFSDVTATTLSENADATITVLGTPLTRDDDNSFAS